MNVNYYAKMVGNAVRVRCIVSDRDGTITGCFLVGWVGGDETGFELAQEHSRRYRCGCCYYPFMDCFGIRYWTVEDRIGVFTPLGVVRGHVTAITDLGGSHGG